MNDKTNQQKSRQDSEELLVTSSTSSPSNLIDTRTSTITTTPSSSPTSTSTRLVIGARSSGSTSAAAAGGLRGGSLCPVVTSSTVSTTSNIVTINLDDDDEDDDGSSECIVGVDDPQHSHAGTSDDSSSSRHRIPSAGSRHAEMGGLPSQNDGDTCIVISTSSGGSSSSAAGCSERMNDTSRRNMLLTMRSADANNAATEGNVSTVGNSTAVNVPSTPTTRSKRKLLNSDHTGPGESGGSSSSTTANAATSTHGVSRSSINLNYNKNVGVDIKNHQSATVKKKTNATATTTLSSSISNSTAASHSSGEPSTPGKAPKGGKNMDTMKNCNEDTIAEEDSRNCQDESTESQSGDNRHHHQNVRTDEDAIPDNRKVEPIKINLSRDVVKSKITLKASVAKDFSNDQHLVVPKLTIKSSPALSDSSSSSILSFNDSEPTMQNCSNDQSSDLQDESQQSHHSAQPQVVPKLIIRASDCNNTSFVNSDVKHALVPKLTIKMDNSVNCLPESNENDSSLSPSPSSSPLSGEQLPSHVMSPQPPLPKLTIKTLGDTAESIISSSFSSASSAVLLSPPPGSSAQPTVPKLTIKNISKSAAATTAATPNDTALVPKLTIRTSGAGSVLQSSSPTTTTQLGTNAATDTGTSSHDDSSRTNSPIPKFTIKTVPSQDANSGTPSVPRLKICTKQLDDTSEVSEVILSPTVPKFTIKSVQESEQSIPKLTISVNDRTPPDTSSSSSSEPVSKLAVVRHADQPDNGERVPKLTITIQESPKVKSSLSSIDHDSTTTFDKPEKLPKLTIKTTLPEPDCDEKTIPKLTIKTVCTDETEAGEKSERVPKITIKTVTAEPSPEAEKVPKLTIKTVSASSEPSPEAGPEKIPKLTIKTVSTPAEPSPEAGVEKIPKLTIKTVSAPAEPSPEASTEKIPKLTIKTVSTPAEPSPEASAEKIPKLTIKTVSTPSEPSPEASPEKIPKLTIKTVSTPTDTEHEPVLKLTIKTTKCADGGESATCDKVEKVPKLTIKAVTDSPDVEKVPKLTIKPIPEQPIVVANTSTQYTDVSLDEAAKITTKLPSEHIDMATKERVPKLTIKQIVDSETSDRSSLIVSSVPTPQSPETSGRIPKITIKPVPEAKVIDAIDLTEEDMPEAIPKLKIKSHSVTVSQLEPTSADKIPKLTIRTKSTAPTDSGEPVEKKPKLVVQQSVHQSAEESDSRIPKLTIKQIPNNVDVECTAASSISSPKVPKLTINNHGTPGKHLKRGGRRKKGEPPFAFDGESASNDSAEMQLVQDSKEPAATENQTIKTRSSSRNSDNKSSDSPTSQKSSVQSKNGPVKAADLKNDKQSAVIDTATILAVAAVDSAVVTFEKTAAPATQSPVVENSNVDCILSERECRFDLASTVNSIEASSTETMETDISELSRNDANLELELERITSQSNSELNSIVIAEPPTQNNLEISADLSDAAINDLVDILNDDDLDDIASLGNNAEKKEGVEEDESNGEIDTINEKEQRADDDKRGEATQLNCVGEPESETQRQQPPPPVLQEATDEKKTEEKSDDNCDDIVSLGSDEDDIVDQLTELLNEAVESSDVVVIPSANGETSSEAKVEKPCPEECGETVASPGESDETKVSVAPAEQESSKPVADTAVGQVEVPEVIDTVKNGSLTVSTDSSSNFSEIVSDSLTNCEKILPAIKADSLLELALSGRSRTPPKPAAKDEPPKAATKEVRPKAATKEVPPKAATKEEPHKAATKEEPHKAATKEEPPKAATKEKSPKAVEKAEPLKAATKEEPPKAATKEEPPKAVAKEEPPKAVAKEETRKAATKEEPPKAVAKEERPKAVAKEEPPKAVAKEEPPKAVTKEEPPKEPETPTLDDKRPTAPRTRTLRDSSLIDPIPVNNEIKMREKTPMELRAERRTSRRQKRNAVDETAKIIPPKRTRSALSRNSCADEVKLSSHMPVVENCVNSSATVVSENNCLPTTESSKQLASSIIEIDSSSTSNETFRTLTELKPINSVNDDDESASNKLDGEESSPSTLKGILMRLQQQDTPGGGGGGTTNSMKGNLTFETKRIEPEIAVIRSSPPPKNSLKTTQSVLLINEDTGSGDCILAEEDPLMLMPETIDSDVEDVMKQRLDDDDRAAVEDEYVTPAKRPRGRPRKDGKPAGSVVRRGRRMVDSVSTRKRPQSSLLDGAEPATRRELQGTVEKDKAMVLNHVFQTPEPAFRLPLKDSPIKFEPSAADMATPVTPPRRGRGRGRGSRGGGGGSSIIQNESLIGDSDNENSESIVRSRGRGRGSSIYRSRGRGRGRGSRGGRGRGFARRLLSPDKRRDGEFFTPERPSLQVFEEDTRMSAESFTPGNRQFNDTLLNNNDENTQSSMMSSSSALDGSSNATILNPLTGEREPKKKRAKMEVFAPEGKTEYTVDMICEYDWPPPKGCCPARNRDSFMIQEQIAQYLGIKSFKRKYPDLPRRQIDMEERNYLQEKGLVTEKMCDLGITAVWASDVLDIMYSDFYEKFEEYKAYLREKQVRDVEAKQRAQAAEAVDKSLQARDRALESTKMWNSSFNKARLEERRSCLDLQNLIIHLPAAVGEKLSRPNETIHRQPSHYPIALVPGQFSENYRSYSAEELRQYPINTILDPFDDRLSQFIKREVSDDENSAESEDEDDSDGSSGSDSDTGSSSDSQESESSSSSDEEEADDEDGDKPPDDKKFKCYMCHQPQNKNQRGFPELFIQCVTCRKQIHPSCIEMSGRMVMRVRNYNWQCADCKCCIKCKRKQDESKMLYCEQCDRGYHIYCIQIKNIPDGRWSCERCAVCMRCGSTKPEGNLPPPPLQPNQKAARRRLVKWVNDYRAEPVTKIREHCSILCLPCSRLRSKPKTTPAPITSPTPSLSSSTTTTTMTSPTTISATTATTQ